MKLFIFLAAAMLSLGSVPLQAKEVFLAGIYTNALGAELPYSIFSKKNWSPEGQAHFVKLHLYFEEPLRVKSIEINTCGSKMNPEMSVFFNFDQWAKSSLSHRGEEVPKAFYPRKTNDLLILEGIDKNLEVHSLTLNFEENSGFKICHLQLKDPKGQVYIVKPPALVTGKVQASSTREPVSAYDPLFLFDSRFESGWSSNKQNKNIHLKFLLDQPRRIEKIQVWSGVQRSLMPCVSPSRAKRLKITGDNGYQTEISFKNLAGSQVIKLPKPFEGKEFKLEILESYGGKSSQDLTLSEIRFFDGKEWFLLDPTSKLNEIIAYHQAQFTKAKVAPLINDSYKANQEIKKDPFWISSKIRLRADGSFYLSGYFGEGEGTEYFSLGRYEVKEADESKGLKLRLLGGLYESAAYGDGDCDGCGQDCPKNETAAEGTKQKTFDETITIKPSKKGKFEISNDSGGKSLNFKKLEFSKEIWTL